MPTGSFSYSFLDANAPLYFVTFYHLARLLPPLYQVSSAFHFDFRCRLIFTMSCLCIRFDYSISSSAGL
jgi:hypothetical protein